MMFRLAIVESPYKGTPAQLGRNLTYARACLRDCFLRGEAPFASHLLYTQPGVLDDNIPEERVQGIVAGLAWGVQADVTVVYTDLGISEGMQRGIESAEATGRKVEYRTLPGWEYRGPRC